MRAKIRGTEIWFDVDGAGLVAELIRKADDRIIIMPGSGLKSGNVRELAEKTGATEFHTSARKDMGSRMEYTNAAMQENLRSVTVDEEEIKKMQDDALARQKAMQEYMIAQQKYFDSIFKNPSPFPRFPVFPL